MGADNSKQIIPSGVHGTVVKQVTLDFGSKDRWDQCFVTDPRKEDGQLNKVK